MGEGVTDKFSSDWADTKEGPCPHKQGENWTCDWHRAFGPIICNLVDMELGAKTCRRFYRMCELRELMPELWGQPCCIEWAVLMLNCAEEDGHMAGVVDVRIYPNDGKNVWRNYKRVRLRHCPFCGAEKPQRGK